MLIITFQWFTQFLKGSLHFTTLPEIVDAYISHLVLKLDFECFFQ